MMSEPQPQQHSSAVPFSRNRVAAKNQVRAAWHERRRQQQQQLRQQQQEQKPAQKEEDETTAVASARAAENDKKETVMEVAVLADEQQLATPPPPPRPPPPPPASVCHILQKTWKDLFFFAPQIRQQEQQQEEKKEEEEEGKSTQHKPSSEMPAPPPQQKMTKTFPSVLAILEANELYKQVESIQQLSKSNSNTIPNSDRDDSARAHGSKGADPLHVMDSSTQSSTSTSRNNMSLIESQVLSVLPAGYDWNQAVREMAASRGRAFLLVDLAAIVRRTVEWKRLLLLPKNNHNNSKTSSSIRFLYQVQSNADAPLLKVLRQSGIVGLTTTTQWDVSRAAAAVATTATTTAAGSSCSCSGSFYDNCAVTGKPDGYLREWWMAQQEENADSSNGDDNDDGCCSCRCLAVDGPDEVQRIQRSLQRIWARRRRQQQCAKNHPTTDTATAPPRPIHFMLRLNDKDPSNWLPLVQATAQQLSKNNNINMNTTSPSSSRLVGISLDMPFCSLEEEGETAIQQLRQQAALETLLNDMAQLRTNCCPTIHDRLRIDLTKSSSSCSNMEDGRQQQQSSSSFPQPQQQVAWWKQLAQRSDVGQVTIDATAALVASTGALCTRIIGVKEEEQQAVQPVQQQQQEDEVRLRRRHYFIDDGCYGSLYQGQSNNDPTQQQQLCPLPLLSRSSRNNSDAKDDEKNAARSDKNDNNPHDVVLYTTSTVWGPTCDGLDRVCRDIPLPNLHRDDWLVFPNVGCGNNQGLGTAFNGFDPPDTCYCVLGYFRKQTSDDDKNDKSAT